MRVLTFTEGADPAGISASIEAAFHGVPGWHVQSWISRRNYLAYPARTWDRAAVMKAWRSADVVHVHQSFRSAIKLERRLGTRPMVIHHHGSPFRRAPSTLLKEQRRRGAIGVVSTLDLYLIAPDELEWLPAPIDVARLAAMRSPHGTDIIRIAHAPTRRSVKSTDAFLGAVARLQRAGYPVEVDLIERVPWHKCLRRKATADLYYDQVALGYGSNALEAWAMGIPVIAGAADRTLEEMQRRIGYLPFYPATESTLYDAIRSLLDNPGLRDECALGGSQYVRRFHDHSPSVVRLQDIYRRAASQPRAA